MNQINHFCNERVTYVYLVRLVIQLEQAACHEATTAILKPCAPIQQQHGRGCRITTTCMQLPRTVEHRPQTMLTPTAATAADEDSTDCVAACATSTCCCPTYRHWQSPFCCQTCKGVHVRHTRNHAKLSSLIKECTCHVHNPYYVVHAQPK
jgi:hypothetical protein